jgi:5,10-methylenetetrahydromethanopterin reductase
VGAPRIGVVLSGEGMPLHELVDYGVGLEDAGFDSVWHEEIFREPFVPLAAIAARTSRIKLGTAVSTWVRTPVSSALMSANLDQLSNGRYVHGVGTGPPSWNELYHNIGYHQPVARMREYMGAVRTAWTGHSGRFVDYDGEHYPIKGYFRPIVQEREEIPLYLAAVQKNMLRLAGAVADGVIFNILTTPAYYRGYAFEHLAEGARRAGRSIEDVHRASMVCVAVDDDAAQAREWARHQIAFFAQIPYFEVIMGPHGLWEPAAAIREAAERGDVAAMVGAVTDEMVDTLTVAGTPDQCRKRLEDWNELDSVLLIAPSYHLRQEEIAANYRNIAAAFAA